MFKVDVFIPQRRVPFSNLNLPALKDKPSYLKRTLVRDLKAPEDTILSKLEWFRFWW